MADPFQNIAEKLAKTTFAPSREAAALEQIGQGVSAGITKKIEPFRQAQTKDIITGEFAATPFRMNLAKLSGRKDWAALANQWETVRNQYVNWKPSKAVAKGEGEAAAPVIFDKKFIASMKPGESITIGDKKFSRNSEKAGSGYVLTTPEGDLIVASKSGTGDQRIRDLFNTNIGVTPGEPGEPVGKTKEQLRKEMRFLRAKINRIIPGTSELEKLVAREDRLPRDTGGLGRRGFGDAGLNREFELKFKANESYIRDLGKLDKGALARVEALTGDVPYSSIHGLFLTYLRQLNSTFTKRAIADGKFTAVHNASLNALAELDEPLIDRHFNAYKSSIVNDINAINKAPTEKERILKSYALLLRIAPTVGNPVKAFTGAIGQNIMFESFKKSQMGLDGIRGGGAAVPLLSDDYNKMVDVVLKQRSKDFKTSIEDKGTGLFDETMDILKKNIDPKFFRKAGSFFASRNPETIRDIIATNLVRNIEVSKLAPITAEAFARPSRTQQAWLDLYRAATGRDATFNDIKRIEKVVTPVVVPPGGGTVPTAESRFEGR